MELAYQRLSAALAEVESEAEVLQKTRPPFLFLQPKVTRSTFTSRMLNAEESLVALSNGVEKLERLRPILHAWVEDELETYLRATHEGYVTGLATHRFPEDWERFGRRFAMRVQRLTEFLHSLRNALTRVASSAVVAENAATADVLARTAKVGAAVDAEVVFLNHLADVQRRARSLGSESLERQPALSCEAHVYGLRTLSAGEAVRALADFAAMFQVQSQQVRGVIVSEGNLAVAGEGRSSRGFVLPQWEALRKLVRLDLDPDTTEKLAADTEKLLGGNV